MKWVGQGVKVEEKRVKVSGESHHQELDKIYISCGEDREMTLFIH